jgi:hypothetical protein
VVRVTYNMVMSFTQAKQKTRAKQGQEKNETKKFAISRIYF